MEKWQSRETIRKGYLDSLPPSELLRIQPYQYALRFGAGACSPTFKARTYGRQFDQHRPINFDFDEKAGFRPSQPRWLSGNGRISGRWSGGAGTGEPISGNGSKQRGGHHFVTREIFKNEPLRPETRKVFDDDVTGRLMAGPHRNDAEHKIYNRAVRELYDRFLSENGIQSQDMTPEQAREFLRQVKTSPDPRIRDFNLKIYRREIFHWLRRNPVLRGTE